MNNKLWNYYEAFMDSQIGRRIVDNIADPLPILSREYDCIPAVYRWSVNTQGKDICLYIGESNDLHRRLLEHLHRWFASGRYLEYHTGLPDSSNWRYDWTLRIDILAANNDIIDPVKRIAKERELIPIYKPYLQSEKYPKYSNSGRIDECIVPFGGIRSKAFKDALKGEHWL